MTQEGRCVKCGNIVQKEGCPVCGGLQYIEKATMTLHDKAQISKFKHTEFALNIIGAFLGLATAILVIIWASNVLEAGKIWLK